MTGKKRKLLQISILAALMGSCLIVGACKGEDKKDTMKVNFGASVDGVAMTGDWKFAKDSFSTQGSKAESTAFTKTMLSDYSFSYLVKVDETATDGDAVLGAYAYYMDMDNYVKYSVNPAENTITIKWSQGFDSEERTNEFDQSVDFSDYVAFKVEKIGTQFKFLINGEIVQSRVYDFEDSVQVGFVNNYLSASYKDYKFEELSEFSEAEISMKEFEQLARDAEGYGTWELKDGVIMLLKNGVVTSAAGFTINVNGLGAKPAYNNMSAAGAETTLFNVNYTMLFIYDEDRVEGGCWILYRGYNSNDNTIGYQLRTNSTRMPMDSITYRYRLLFRSVDGTSLVPANNSSSTNATAARAVITTPIDPFGPIIYYGTTASVAAGAMPAAAYMWEQYNITLGYSFNRTGAALTLTSWDPVYIKATPQAAGGVVIDPDTPYVQALPNTNDGKVYIYLGIATSATTVELNVTHPVYYHDGTRIRLWT